MKTQVYRCSSARTALPGFVCKLFALAAITVVGVTSTVEFALAQAEDEPEISGQGSTEINIKNADIAAVVRIFSKRTKRNYILDERVKGKVTIYLPGRVSADEAIRILDSVLALKGFTSVPIGDNLWKIIPTRDAKQTTIPTVKRTDGRGSPAVVTRLINLKYVSADDVKQLLGPLVSGEGLMNAYTGTNSLIMIDSEENIKRLVQIIESIDIPFSDREMTIIPIEHADAVDIAEKITQILSDSEEGDSGASTQQNLDFMRSRLGQSTTARRANTPVRATNTGAPGEVVSAGGSTITVSARARAPKIIADERTNAIIVVADEDTTTRIRALVSELDSKVDLSGNRFYVYRCQHANAEDLADVLSGLTGSGGSSSSSTRTSTGSSSSRQDSLGLNSGSLDRGNRFQRTQDRLTGQRRTPGRSRTEDGSGGSGASTVNFGEDVSITADPSTNSLIINAGKADYGKIVDLLKRLDVKRRQVLVEALLLEVGISDTLSMGTEWIASTGGQDGGVIGINNGGNLQQLFTNPAELSQFSVAAASAGTLELPNNITIPSQTVLVRAAQNLSNVNVLSSPTILATDNEDAEIVVGQNVPFLASTSTSSDNLNNTFNQIDRQDVGITLRITPQISSSDFVTLRLFTEVSNVIPGTESSELGPTTTIRTSETTVITKNGQMIVTGGLMSDDIQESESGVPFLKDIPVLGHLFRDKIERQARTNLLIFITPRIIKDQFDARDVTLSNRDILQRDIDNYEVYPSRKEFLERMELDRVTEAEIYNGDKPGTIFQPARPGDQDSDIRLEDLEGHAALKREEVPNSVLFRGRSESEQMNAVDASGNDPISVQIAPVLPPAPEKRSTNESDEKPSVASNAGPRAAPRVPPAVLPGTSKQNTSGEGSVAKGSVFVVLEAANPGEAPHNLPFEIDAENSIVGIVVPAETTSAAKKFFSAGTTYHYAVQDTSVPLTVAGVFPSAEEASSMFGNMTGRWYNLSPYEIMNIGNGPWFRN